MREAHAHLYQHGRAMGMLPLDRCGSLGEALEMVRGAPAGPSGGWILGTGMRTEGWPEARPPTRDELDRAAGGRPCALWSFDHHAIATNSAGLAAAGIDDAMPDPEGGRIVREGGRATGLLLEMAARMLWTRLPEPAWPERLRLVSLALEDLARHGFGEVHELLAPPWLGECLGELDRAGRLPVRVRLHPLIEHLEEVARGAAAWESPRVRLGGGKVFADGTLNSRTALMLEPYADPLPGLARGQAMMDGGSLAAAMALARRMGLDLAAHAIGDGAVRAVLDAWESLGPIGGPSRLRIEHAEIIDAADVARLARPRFGEVIVSVQPCHLLADIEALRRGLPHRLDRVLPLRELIDAGCGPGERLWFGSDVPIVRPHPGDSIRAAVHRRREGMGAGDAIAPGQAITEAEAWACFGATSGGRAFGA